MRPKGSLPYKAPHTIVRDGKNFKFGADFASNKFAQKINLIDYDYDLIDYGYNYIII